MSFHLTVAGSLEPLADALADLLAEPHADTDPFEPELLVVPSAGVRSWLAGRLSARLGATARGSDGIAANLRWEFPGRIVTVALGPESGLGAWETDRLTWAVYDELVADADRYGQPVDAVRARVIADRFDRYTLHRPSMVRDWEAGRDALAGGVDLPPQQRWQPDLWREVRARTGGRSDARAMRDLVEALHAGEVDVEAPARVVVFGLASLPPPHLQLLGALSRTRDVHVFAPAPSGARWRRLVAALPPDLGLPIPRDDDRFPSLSGHPLVTDWGRASTEAHALLQLTAVAAGAGIDDRFAVVDGDDTLLHRVQRDLVADVAPPGPPVGDAPDQRVTIDESDTSIRWLTCYGAARQVEVLRDAILHLLAETDATGAPRFAPRDIAVLTPDIARFAPLVQAVFAGDERHGVPAIPLEVADRSLRQDNPLVDALFRLFDLTERRFRASDLLAFIASPVVGRRFDLDVDAVERISIWVDAANVRWGIDDADLERYGVPAAFDAFTWRAAIDRLLLGAALPDGPARLGPGDVAPVTGVEGDDVVIAGRLAELVRRLALAVERITTPAPVGAWCAAVAESVTALFRLSSDEAWASTAVDRAITALVDEASAGGRADEHPIEPAQLADLLKARLEAGAGRPRFGTGAVTLSSFTAQRGVPFPVICLLGLDGEAAPVTSVDDLLAVVPCIGDRDARAEQRAQMLDAVLAAGDRLVVLSNGRDVRSNTRLPPIAMFAEFLEVLDATAVGWSDATRAAREAIAVEHPRQAWSERSFLDRGLGVSGPWSFDEGALGAARARMRQDRAPDLLIEPVAPIAGDGDEVRVSIDELVTACTAPVRAFLSDRLGITIPDDDGPSDRDDSIPFALDHLEQSVLDRGLLATRLDDPSSWDAIALARWSEVAGRSGAVPPGSLGRAVIGEADVRVASVLALASAELDLASPVEAVPVRVEVPAGPTGGPTVVVEGIVEGIRGDAVAEIAVRRLRDSTDLAAWIRLALVTMADPSRSWRSVIVGRATQDQKATRTRPAKRFSARELRLVDPTDAAAVVAFAVDLWCRTRRDAIPFFPATSRKLHLNDDRQARVAWDDTWNGFGDRQDRWVATVFDLDFDELLALEPRADESTGVARARWWADRVWSMVDDTCVITDLAHSPGVGSGGAP